MWKGTTMVFTHLIVFLLMFGLFDAATAKDLSTVTKAPLQQSGKETHFRGVSWGMSPAQVKASETASYMYSEAEGLMFGGEVAGMPVDIMYMFHKGELIGGSYVFKATHLNSNQYIEDFAKIKEILRGKYGNPRRDERNWKGDLFKDSNHWGTAVVMGQLVLLASWQTDTTEIFLVLSGDNFKASLITTYGQKDRFYNYIVEDRSKANRANF
jgi:hypothetical protein